MCFVFLCNIYIYIYNVNHIQQTNWLPNKHTHIIWPKTQPADQVQCFQADQLAVAYPFHLIGLQNNTWGQVRRSHHCHWLLLIQQWSTAGSAWRGPCVTNTTLPCESCRWLVCSIFCYVVFSTVNHFPLVMKTYIMKLCHSRHFTPIWIAYFHESFFVITKENWPYEVTIYHFF